MASWKKVVVSGSAAHLSSVTASNLTDTNLVIAGIGGALKDSTLTLTGGTLALGSNSITSTGASSVLSGSFSGSFSGTFSGMSSTLNISGSTGNGSVNLGDETLTIAGTTNEIETSAAGQIITIGLPDNVTVSGNLTVSGSTTLGDASGDSVTINAATVNIANVAGGTSDTVVIKSSNNLATRDIDTRVWGATLISGSGAVNQVAFFDASTGITGANGFTYVPGTTTLTVPNLTVTGTASFQETTNTTVADRFILLASGSDAATPGGIVVQQDTNGIGEVFGWDTTANRWAVTSSFEANQSSFTPDAFMATVVEGGTDPTTTVARYTKKGNLYIGSDEAIWIYS
jgi:hypothetical protein